MITDLSKQANQTDQADQAKLGGCLCSAVRFRINGQLRPVVACHCGQCRRIHSHFAVFSSVQRDHLIVENPQAVTWYESSPGVRRGFCARCGASLFWDKASLDALWFSAGALDQPTGLHLSYHIFTADKGDFYEIEDDLDQFPQEQGAP